MLLHPKFNPTTTKDLMISFYLTSGYDSPPLTGLVHPLPSRVPPQVDPVKPMPMINPSLTF